MKDLHVKYPKQTGRQIHLKSGGGGDELNPCYKTHLSASVSLELGTTCLSVGWHVHLSHLRLLNTVDIFFVYANNLKHKKYFGKLLIEREIMYACINHDLTLRTSTSNNRFLLLPLWRWTANNNNDSSGNNKDVGNSCRWLSCQTKVLILNANDKHAVGFRSEVSLDDLWALTTLTNITAGHPFALEDSDENIFLVLG